MPSVRVESLVCTVEVIGPSHFAGTGSAGAHRRSEALHPTRSSDVLPRIARERVPTVPHVAKTRRNGPRRIARPYQRLFLERFLDRTWVRRMSRL